MTTELDRCKYLFANLLRHTQYGAVNKEHCIAAAEAGAWCLAEIARLIADRDNSNRLLDECRLERNTLQKVCAVRADEIDEHHRMIDLVMAHDSNLIDCLERNSNSSSRKDSEP